jgi:IMP dehydrogenase
MRHAIGEIVARRRVRPLTLDASAPVRRAVRLMNSARIGVVLVTSQGKLVGIVTERDVLRRIVDGDVVDLAMPLDEVMSSPVQCAPRHMPADEAMRLLSESDHRHLAVVDEGVPLGVVSVGDLMNEVTRDLERSVVDLSTFISGPAATVELPTKVFGERGRGQG